MELITEKILIAELLAEDEFLTYEEAKFCVENGIKYIKDEKERENTNNI